MGLSNPDLLTRTDPSARTREQEVAYCADPFGNWTHLDPSWSDLTGHPVGQCVARPMSEFIHPDDRKRHNEAVQSLIRGEI